jgi:predicted ATPase
MKLDANLARHLNKVTGGMYSKHETKQILAETHSENIILRVQRRIREGLVDADDVSVIYVDSVDGTSRATQIEIGPEGDFIQSWPKSFVDIRLDDLMQ